MIDPRCDAEVADITGEQNQQPVNQTMNTSYDSTQANSNQGLPQVNQVSLNQHLGTLQSGFLCHRHNRQKVEPDT